MPPEGVPQIPRHDILRFEEIVTVVRFLRDRYGLHTVRLTGGEALVRPQIVRLAEMLVRLALADLALTTNGQRLSALARPLRNAGIDRVNISLDSLDRARFSRLTRGGRLDRTLAGVEAARKAGFHSVKINTVVLRGENDSEVCDLVRFAGAAGLEIRFLELMSIGIAAERHSSWFVSSHEVRKRLETEFRLVALEGPCKERTRTYLAEDSRGCTTRVGFISPETEPFCASCRRLRLTSEGRLLGCLMHSTGPDLLPLLRSSGGLDYAGLDRAIRAALEAKPALRSDTSSRLMAGIGG
jgi:cyclic pyranopterin phosphate synthase